MYRPRSHTLMLMSAMAAALSVGGVAATVIEAAPEYPDDGKIRLQHTTNEQLCEFDTREQADTFVAGVDDPDNWRPVGPNAPVPNHHSFDLGQLRDSLKEDGNQATALLDAAGSPLPNPHFGGTFEGETDEQAAERRATAAAPAGDDAAAGA